MTQTEVPTTASPLAATALGSPTATTTGAVALTAAPGGLLDRLADTLADPQIERWLGYPARQAIDGRLARDLDGSSVHAILLVDGQPAGWAGWLRYVEDPARVETTTYLGRPYWRTGLNRRAKALIWQVAHAAGVPVVGSVHIDNQQSCDAMIRLWPDAPREVVYEARKERRATIFHIQDPPQGVSLDWPLDEVRVLASRVRLLPTPCQVETA